MKHVERTLYMVSSILKSNNYAGNVIRAPSCIGFFYEFSRRCFCICYFLNYGHGFLNAQEMGWELAAQVSMKQMVGNQNEYRMIVLNM